VLNWGVPEQQAARRLYALLGQLSKQQLTGGTDTLPAGTFWTAE
jgi:NitT/TauT family transport system substrate-binding protein